MITFNYGSIKSTNKSPIGPNISAQQDQQDNIINISYNLNDNIIDPVVGPQNVELVTITRHSSHIRDNLFNFNTGKFEKNYPIASQSFIGKDSSQIHSRPIFSPGSFNRSQIALSPKPPTSTIYSAQVVPGTNYTIDFDTLSITIPNITSTGTIVRQDLISENGLYYFDLDITATYSGEAIICYTVPENVYFDNLEFCHINPDGTYEIITSSKNPATREICGKSSSFSPFVFTDNSQIEAENTFDLIVSGANSTWQTVLNPDGSIQSITRSEPSPCSGAQTRSYSFLSGFGDCGCYELTITVSDVLSVLEALAILVGVGRGLRSKTSQLNSSIKSLKSQKSDNISRIRKIREKIRNLKKDPSFGKSPWDDPNDINKLEKEASELIAANAQLSSSIASKTSEFNDSVKLLAANAASISAAIAALGDTPTYIGEPLQCEDGEVLNSETCECDYSDYSN